MHAKPFVALVGAAALAACAAGALSSAALPPPKAYVVAEITVKDLAAYRRYAAAAFPIIQKYGGTFLTRGGTTVAVEGTPPAERVMIIEFASLAQAKVFEYSPEYEAIAPLRQSSADSRLFIIEGTADARASKP
ncbi:DUF1330 domain-containing protein [Croceibacterium aestuarii]|uniref:DUF1330 domain-containing protein n=1 Tax=Croceibacterium aestuarii TaxID=3064139 RepID=UPI00272EC33A|nr:DUF1330 domain-containing protein [Croceibacterium sp. D39]